MPHIDIEGCGEHLGGGSSTDRCFDGMMLKMIQKLGTDNHVFNKVWHAYMLNPMYVSISLFIEAHN